MLPLLHEGMKVMFCSFYLAVLLIFFFLTFLEHELGVEQHLTITSDLSLLKRNLIKDSLPEYQKVGNKESLNENPTSCRGSGERIILTTIRTGPTGRRHSHLCVSIIKHKMTSICPKTFLKWKSKRIQIQEGGNEDIACKSILFTAKTGSPPRNLPKTPDSQTLKVGVLTSEESVLVG